MSQSDNTSKDQPVDEPEQTRFLEDEIYEILTMYVKHEAIHNAVQDIARWHNQRIQAECNRALAAQRQALRDEVMGEIKEQLEAAQKNLDYQTHETHNENLIREWQGAVQGIRFCEEAISTIFEDKK